MSGRRGSGSSRGSSLDSWTLIGASGAEQEAQAALADEVAEEARESLPSETSSRAMSTASMELVGSEASEAEGDLTARVPLGADEESEEEAEEGEEEGEEEAEDKGSGSGSEFAHVSEDSELEELRAAADNLLNGADEGLSASSASSSVLGELRQGHYVIDQQKLHRLFDALSNSSRSSDADAAPALVHRQPAQALEYSEELPVNWVQRYSSRICNYIHEANNGLNWKLSLLLTIASAMVLGLGIGHFMGSTHNWLRRHRVAGKQVEQLRSLQDALVGCVRRAEDAEALGVGLQYRLAGCQDVASHCSVDERPSAPLPDQPTTPVPDQPRPLGPDQPRPLGPDQAFLPPPTLADEIPPSQLAPETPTHLPSLDRTGERRLRAQQRRLSRQLLALQAQAKSAQDSASAAHRRARTLEADLWRAQASIRELNATKAPKSADCPQPSYSERARQAQHWLNLSNLTSILDSYLEAIGDADLTGLGEDSVKVVWDQLAELGNAAERIRDQLVPEVQSRSEELRSRLETALARVWDTATTAAARFQPADFARLRDDLGEQLNSLLAFPSAVRAPSPSSVRLCPHPLPPSSQTPQQEMRQLRGLLKRSSLWDEVGQDAVYPYLGELKRLSKQRVLGAEGAGWWEDQRRWWLSCQGSGDAELEWQDSEDLGALLHRDRFLADNPQVRDFVGVWLEGGKVEETAGAGEAKVGASGPRAEDWEGRRGEAREALRAAEGRAEWLWERQRERAEKRSAADPSYAANEWSFRRGKARQHQRQAQRAKGDFHSAFRQAHFRSFA